MRPGELHGAGARVFAHAGPLLDHRWFGTSIRRWRERRAIPRKAKILAIGSMAVGYAVLLVGTQPAWWVDLVVAAGLIASAGYVATRPDA